MRPAFNRPGEQAEEPIAKLRHVRSRNVWRLHWKQADGKWHGYQPCPEVETLADALRIIHEDANCYTRAALSTSGGAKSDFLPVEPLVSIHFRAAGL